MSIINHHWRDCVAEIAVEGDAFTGHGADGALGAVLVLGVFAEDYADVVVCDALGEGEGGAVGYWWGGVDWGGEEGG